jgi:ribosome biogenesis protein SSF1/2
MLVQSLKRGNIDDNKSAIRLHELGPRLTIELYKIESDLLTGEVLYHKSVVKTQEELLAIKKKRADKRVLKEQRKKVQEANKLKKEKAKEEHKIKTGGSRAYTVSEADKKLIKDAEDALDDGEDEDDAEYYKEEIGEKPDKELFQGAIKSSRKRPHIPKMKMPKIKRPRLENADQKGDRKKGKFGEKDGDRKFGGKKFNKDGKKMGFKTGKPGKPTMKFKGKKGKMRARR